MACTVALQRPVQRSRGAFAAAYGWALRELSSAWGLEVIVIGDVWNSHDEDSHPAESAMDDAWRDMNERSLGNGMLNAIEEDATAPLENVVKLGRTLVVMEFGSIDIHRMGPSRRRQRGVLVADETVTPAAGTTLAGSVALMANQDRTRNRSGWGWIAHWH